MTSKLKEFGLDEYESLAKREKKQFHESGEVIRSKNLQFYKELKQKRIAKIKSKLYHKIKLRQKEKAQNDEQVDQQKLIEERLKERIT